MTAYAANAALPGDRLNPYIIATENVRARLVSDDEQPFLYLDFAGRRLAEMQMLIIERRFGRIPPAAGEFERDIQKCLEAVQRLSQTQPARAGALRMELSVILQSYSSMLAKMLVHLSPESQPPVHSAINISVSALIWLDIDIHIDEDDDHSRGIGGRRMDVY